MLKKIEKSIKNKSVLILGFGKEGRSTFSIIKKAGGYKQLDISDKFVQTLENNENQEHKIISGDNYMDCIDSYDIVVKSPGIVLDKDIDSYKATITSQTDLFIDFYQRQIVGITGTKGKSTVSTLLFHSLKELNFDCLLAGNIGLPVFDIIDEITPKTIIVLELSCHQLQYCKHSPSVSLLLNLYEDHLDHYKTFENYVKAKVNIYKNQFSLDTLYVNSKNVPSKDSCNSRVITVKPDCFSFDSLDMIEGVKLRGEHNLLNCAFVFNVLKSFNVSEEDFICALKTYNPLPHRLEFLGKKNDVSYYDDSISTTVESTISAISSIKDAKIVLIGGMDRGIDYQELVEFLPTTTLNHVVFMYESGKKIFDMLNEENIKTDVNYIYAEDLYKATELIQKIATPNTSCILSPAAASYGDFKNFEERGNVFRKLVFEN